MDNALMVIFPYRHEETWVFDDANVDLVQEPFVFGIPAMINDLVKGIPNAQQGFRLIFSQKPVPRYQRELSWAREECDGNWYALDNK